MVRRGTAPVLAVIALLVAACGGAAAPTSGGTQTPTAATTAVSATPTVATPTIAPTAASPSAPSPTPITSVTGTAPAPSASPTVAATVAASTVPSPSASASASPVPTIGAECQSSALKLKNPGKLTIGADNPAYPPWFGGDPKTQYPGEPAGTEWEIGDPYSGEGYESAVAYSIAEHLGFKREDVQWLYVPFNLSYAPGAKKFDMYLTQVSYSAERAKAVDFSSSYYDVNQAVVGVADKPIAKVTTIAGLKDFKLGAQVGTTSYQTIVDVIQPTTEPQVYDDNDKAVRALKAGQIDGIVVDLPTAFYMRAAQLDNGAVVGQFPTTGEQEHFGAVLEKGSSLTACVDQALGAMRADGSLQKIFDEWLADRAEAPVFK